MKELWNKIQQDPESYRNQNVSILLEEMIQKTTYKLINNFSNKWYVKEEELTFVVNNYNTSKDKQIGEAELKRTSDYEAYRNNTEKPVKRLSYWKTVRKDLDQMMVEDILPFTKNDRLYLTSFS